MRAIVLFPGQVNKKAAGLVGPPPDGLDASRLTRPNATAGPLVKLPKEPEKSERAEEGTDRDVGDHAAVQQT
jgi:hypothetical protein